MLTGFTLELRGIIRWFKVAVKRQESAFGLCSFTYFSVGRKMPTRYSYTFSGLTGRLKSGCVALE